MIDDNSLLGQIACYCTLETLLRQATHAINEYHMFLFVLVEKRWTKGGEGPGGGFRSISNGKYCYNGACVPGPSAARAC